MGTYKPGAIGVVKGAIDTIVTSKWKSIYVIKGKPTKSNKPATLTQAQQRIRFALVTAFLKRIASTIAVGYQNPGKNLTPMNAAVKYHLASTVKGLYPDYEIDYPSIRLTIPSDALDSAWNISVSVGAGGMLTLSWDENKFVSGKTLPTDRMSVLLYDVDKDRFITMGATAARSALTNVIEMPEAYAGDSVHVWAYFVSADGKLVSATDYLGLVKILA
jgi:hypothetical protein